MAWCCIPAENATATACSLQGCYIIDHLTTVPIKLLIEFATAVDFAYVDGVVCMNPEGRATALRPWGLSTSIHPPSQHRHGAASSSSRPDSLATVSSSHAPLPFMPPVRRRRTPIWRQPTPSCGLWGKQESGSMAHREPDVGLAAAATVVLATRLKPSRTYCICR